MPSRESSHILIWGNYESGAVTTEIVIANRGGIALAADSAVTVGSERVWKSAHKLFSLGPNNDIAIMAYGSADYLGTPWEIIIKLFRSRSGKYKKVKDCEDEFFAFLSDKSFRNKNNEKLSFSHLFVERLEDFKKRIKYDNKVEFRSNIIQHCSSVQKTAETRNVVKSSETLDDFREKWQDTIKALAKDIFGEVITNKVREALVSCMYHIALSDLRSAYSSGIVFAGFGEEEIFPVVSHHIVDGRSNEISRCWQVLCKNLNETDALGFIMPFGQDDMIYTFMEGIGKNYLSFISNTITRVMNHTSESIIDDYVKDNDEKLVEKAKRRNQNKEIASEFMKEFDRYRRRSLVDPIINVMAALPKEEMAAMAEAMVEITSLRRRVDSKVESVGGPVDVAILSKGDGFVWIKRKHYFPIEINPSFARRKFASLED